MTPFKYVYRYDLKFYIDIGDTVPNREIPSAKEQVETFKKLHRELQQQMVKTQKHQTKYYNLQYKPKEFKKGQLIKLSI